LTLTKRPQHIKVNADTLFQRCFGFGDIKPKAATLFPHWQ